MLEFLFTRDGNETEQLVTSGSADVGLAENAMQIMRAYAFGAPLRIISTHMAGSTNYWYVPKSSPIHSFADIVGKTVGYETNGASSQYDAIDLMQQRGSGCPRAADGPGRGWHRLWWQPPQPGRMEQRARFSYQHRPCAGRGGDAWLPSIGVARPMARNTTDDAMLLSVQCGYDAREPLSKTAIKTFESIGCVVEEDLPDYPPDAVWRPENICY